MTKNVLVLFTVFLMFSHKLSVLLRKDLKLSFLDALKCVIYIYKTPFHPMLPEGHSKSWIGKGNFLL